MFARLVVRLVVSDGGDHDESVPWTTPELVPADEPFGADERAMLQGFLQYARDNIVAKCVGLGAGQLAQRSAPPSVLSLLGIVRHLTDVERHWLRRRFAGEDTSLLYSREDRPDAAFEEAAAEYAERDLARLRGEWAACDAALDHLDLGHVFHSPRWGEMTLRWGYLHMIREYSAHDGQADILRERIDGRTGL